MRSMPPARARMTLSVAGLLYQTVTWPAVKSVANPYRADAELAVAGDLVAAQAGGCDPRCLDVADAIWRSPAPDSLAWPVQVLHRHPGCAVAASGMTGQMCAVAVRDSYAVSVLADGNGDARGKVLACACFVYVWLTSGWPLEVLGSLRLDAVAAALPAEESVSPDGVVRVSFRLFC